MCMAPVVGSPNSRFSSRAAPGAIEFTELIDGRTVIVASIGGTERRLCDLQTGQELPYERRRIRFAWLRSLYDGLIRRSPITYYAFRGGPPLVAVRFFRKTAIVWDLTASRPLGTWPRGKADARVGLTDGRTVTVPLPPSGRLRGHSGPAGCGWPPSRMSPQQAPIFSSLLAPRPVGRASPIMNRVSRFRRGSR